MTHPVVEFAYGNEPAQQLAHLSNGRVPLETRHVFRFAQVPGGEGLPCRRRVPGRRPGPRPGPASGPDTRDARDARDAASRSEAPLLREDNARASDSSSLGHEPKAPHRATEQLELQAI